MESAIEKRERLFTLFGSFHEISALPLHPGDFAVSLRQIGLRFMNESPSRKLPVRIYSPEPLLSHFWPLLVSMWNDVLAGRQLTWRLFVRDLSAQYRQTYLGYVWAFLPPLAAALTFIFLNSQGIVQLQGTSIPYPAFAMIGTLLWQTFADSFAAPSLSLVSARLMLVKINFPRESVLLAGMCMVVFNFFIRLALLVAVMAYWRIAPGSSLLFFPLALFGLMLTGFAFGLLLAPWAGLYGDIPRAIPMIAQFWMLLTPVVYPARTEGLAGRLAVWNPVSPLMTTAREALAGQALTQAHAAMLVLSLAGAVCLLGFICFRLAMPHVIARLGG